MDSNFFVLFSLPAKPPSHSNSLRLIVILLSSDVEGISPNWLAKTDSSDEGGQVEPKGLPNLRPRHREGGTRLVKSL